MSRVLSPMNGFHGFIATYHTDRRLELFASIVDAVSARCCRADFQTGRGLPAEEFEKFCIQPMAGIVKRA